MKKVTPKIIIVAMVLLLFPTTTLHAAALTPRVPGVAAMVVDAKSGQILAAKNINQPVAAASTSKLLTVYLVNQAIREGKLTWETPVKISPNLAKISLDRELTNVPLIAGHTYSVKALYQAALLHSANAAAMALGEAVSGSSAKFVALMQERLRMWDIHNATINNAAGLLNSQVGSDAVGSNPQTENLISAKDMAIIASHLVNEYPDVLQTTAMPRAKFGNDIVTTTNELLPGGRVKSPYHFDGLKTGTSVVAHQNFVGTLTVSGRRLITIVDGVGDLDNNNLSRFTTTVKLLNQTLSQLKVVTLPAKRLELMAPIKNAAVINQEVTNAEPITVWVPKNAKFPNFTVNVNKKIAAPLKQGAQVGLLRPQGLDYLTTPSSRVADAVTVEPVKRANFFVDLWRTITSWF